MKKAILLISLLIVSACQGWTPLYQNDSAYLTQKIGQINIIPAEDVPEQYLYNALIERLYVRSSPKKSYDLNFTLDLKQSDQALLNDGNTAITHLEIRVHYTLDNNTDQQQFQSQINTSFTADRSALNNEILAQQTTRIAVESLAEMMTRRLALFLTEHPHW
jgi:hypothetical protein